MVFVEEGEPYLEKEGLVVIHDVNPTVKIYGKTNGYFSYEKEYDPDVMEQVFGKILGKNVDLTCIRPKELPMPKRPPTLCAGCPHRATFYAVKKAVRGKDVIYTTDIGCYTLGIQPPHETADFLVCMGSSVGAAGGFSKATDQHIIGFAGDSTFFHSIVPGLINGVYNKDKFVLTVLDNRTTAMTGHQPNPGMGVCGMNEPAPMLMMDDVAKGCGVKYTKVVDPYNIQETIDCYKEAIEYDGVAVVVPKRECALLPIGKKMKKRGSWTVDQEKCKKCYHCIKFFACPAFYKNGDEVHIDPTLCASCGVCQEVCPFDAMVPADPEKAERVMEEQEAKRGDA